MSSEYERYVNSDFVTRLHPKEFATFHVLATESAFSTSGRVLSIQRTRLTPTSLEMCMCLKDHLDAKEHKQDKCPLEIPLDFKKDVFDNEVQRNEATPLSDEEISLDASSEGTLSPG
nr:zinc finger BED domain-containing protein RICESLEEPER 2-like [Tanacetum cinerariifolium]